MSIFKELRQAIMLSCVLLALCGFLYPVALTGTSAVLAPEKSAGSLVYYKGKPVGSQLVGQAFTDPRFMQCRPSAVNYNTRPAESTTYSGVASGSANMGATNPALIERIQAQLDAFLAANPQYRASDIPASLLTASGSGLDPHISPDAARVQLPALAKHTGLSMDTLEGLLAESTSKKLWGIFGEETVHVLNMNLGILGKL